MFDDFSKLVAVVRRAQIISGAYFESLDDARSFELLAERRDKVLAMKLADGFSVNLCLGKIADNEIEAVEIVAPERLRAFASNDHVVTEATECLFKQNTKLIVVVHDEDPAFIH